MCHEQLSQSAVLVCESVPFPRSSRKGILETDHLLLEGLDV